MKTIIFKSEKNAKIFQIISTKNQGVYSHNEIIRIVKTDNIEKILEDSKYSVMAKEVKGN